MKKILGIVVVLGIGVIAYQSNANSIDPNEFTVVMKFTSGNTIALSEKYNGYDSCITSAEYQLHKVVGATSGSNIQCVNELPTYR